MGSTYVRIDLDEFDDDDLITELEGRWLNEDDIIRLYKILKNNSDPKMDLFIRVMEKYSLLELEEMFREKFDSLGHSKDQLKLPLNF